MNAPANLPSLHAGAAVRAIVPQDFDGAWRIAVAVTKAGMAPRGLETPEKAMVAIMHGLEVGFTPMAALQSIAVINGRPTIWGDGALGLVQASGKMASYKEWWEGEGDTRKAFCKVVRKGDPEAKLGEFSVSDAKTAKLWGKTGRNGEPTPWVTHPDRMLKMRARAFALRDGFADVLKGLGITEEQQDIQLMESVKAPPPPPELQQSVEAIKVITQDGQEVDAVQEVEIQDGEEFSLENFLDELNTAMATGKDEAQIIEIWDGFDVEATLTSDEDALQRAFDLRKQQISKLAE